jgi:hypothetical protein
VKLGTSAPLLVAFATLALLGMVPSACSSSEVLSGQGAPCTQVSDCEEGLICGNGPNGAHLCTDDAGSIEPPQAGPDSGSAGDAPGQPPPGDDAASGDATVASTDATVTDSSAAADGVQAPETGSPVVDAEVRDVAKTPVDSGKPEDTGSPQEAAAPPEAGGGADATAE